MKKTMEQDGKRFVLKQAAPEDSPCKLCDIIMRINCPDSCIDAAGPNGYWKEVKSKAKRDWARVRRIAGLLEKQVAKWRGKFRPMVYAPNAELK